MWAAATRDIFAKRVERCYIVVVGFGGGGSDSGNENARGTTATRFRFATGNLQLYRIIRIHSVCLPARVRWPCLEKDALTGGGGDFFLHFKRLPSVASTRDLNIYTYVLSCRRRNYVIVVIGTCSTHLCVDFSISKVEN